MPPLAILTPTSKICFLPHQVVLAMIHCSTCCCGEDTPAASETSCSFISISNYGRSEREGFHTQLLIVLLMAFSSGGREEKLPNHETVWIPYILEFGNNGSFQIAYQEMF